MDQIAKFQKYMQTPEAKKKSDAAKDKAWTRFINEFPNADATKFVSQASIDDNNNFSAEVFFKAGPDLLQSVFGSDRKYWSQQMKSALGLDGVSGFPYQLSPLKKRKALQIPAIDFTEKAPSIAEIYNIGNQIYATPDEYFITKFRDIFKQTRLQHRASAEARTWLRGPNMKYWPVFCATQGCGVSREIFYSGLSLSSQIRSFYQFYFYFTVRRILYQLGGIQSISACRETPHLANSTTTMTWPLIKGYAPSSGLTHRAISALHTAKTTALATFTSIQKTRGKQILTIQALLNSAMKAAKRSKEI